MSDQPKPNEIQIKADEQTLAGHYSNSARITHSFEDVVVDFMYIHGNPPFGKLVSRVLLTPGHAKRLMRALQENLRRYEELFGAIRESPEPPTPAGFLQ